MISRESLVGSLGLFCAGYILAALFFPLLPDLGMSGRILSFLLLTLLSFTSLLPWINLRTRWYYLALLVPMAVQMAVLLFLLFPLIWPVALLLNLCILVYAWGLGKLLGKQLRDTSFLLVILLLCSLADLASVFFGPAAQVPTFALMPCLLLSFPLPGADSVEWFLGFGDIFFFVLLCSFSLKHRLSLEKTLLFQLLAVNLASLLSAYFLAIMPALPLQALAFYLGHRRVISFQFSIRDRNLLIFGVLVIVVILAFFRGMAAQ